MAIFGIEVMSMIDVRFATKRAVEYFEQLFKNGAQNVRLEEVEISDDERYWYVTLGFDLPPLPSTSGLAQVLSGRPERQYKTLKVDAATGEVLSVKIRKV